jgi:hypothetical protein
MRFFMAMIASLLVFAYADHETIAPLEGAGKTM